MSTSDTRPHHDGRPLPHLRGVHTSDVHLGAYDATSLPHRREASHAAFSRVIDVALEEDADFLLIVGDFLDNAFVKDDTLEFAMEEIARFERPTALLAGNHDHVGVDSVYDRIPRLSLPSNLTLFRSPDGELRTLDGLAIEVWGRPHTGVNYAPLREPVPRGEAPWQLALAHGHYVAPGRVSHASYQITAHDIADSGRDYVAMGHWDHMTRIRVPGNTVAAYSGAPSSVGAGEMLGQVLLVDLGEDGSVTLTARSLKDATVVPHDLIPHGVHE